MPEGTVAVSGLQPLIRDFSRLSKTLTKSLREQLRQIAAPVAVDAKFREQKWGARQPQGIRVIVRQAGVSVEQTLRKSGAFNLRRRNFGGLQMREAMLPALHDNEETIMRRTEEWLDTALDHIGGP